MNKTSWKFINQQGEALEEWPADSNAEVPVVIHSVSASMDKGDFNIIYTFMVMDEVESEG